MQLRRVATLLKTSVHQQRCQQHSLLLSITRRLTGRFSNLFKWIRKLLLQVSKLVVLVGSQKKRLKKFCNHFASWLVLLPPGFVSSAPAPLAWLSSTTMTNWKKKADQCQKSFATKSKEIGAAFGIMIGGRVWMITGSLFTARCTATCGPTDLKRLHWSSRTTPSRSILANPYLPFRLGKFFSTTWKVTKTLCGLTLNLLDACSRENENSFLGYLQNGANFGKTKSSVFWDVRKKRETNLWIWSFNICQLDGDFSRFTQITLPTGVE